MSVERNRSGEMEKLVAAEAKEFDPDAIFVDSWLMAQYLPADFTGLKLLHEHNAEFQLWQRQAEVEGFGRKWVVSREAGRVKRYEAAILQRFDWIFAVSDEDRRALRELGADAQKLRVLPNIPDGQLLELPSPVFADTEPLVLYFGTLSWQPNIDGVERFLSVFRFVKKKVPGAQLVVAGKDAPETLAQHVRAAEGAEFLGEVDEPEDLYRRARVLVDAAKTGGGTRLKVLNALARGIPVVASAEAARGLDIVANEHLLVARNDHTMAEAVIELLENSERWRVLSQNGRALVRARYQPGSAFRQLDEALAKAPRRSE
jgi:glycosyltransferase involved in cell wall biosynthesis